MFTRVMWSRKEVCSCSICDFLLPFWELFLCSNYEVVLNLMDLRSKMCKPPTKNKKSGSVPKRAKKMKQGNWGQEKPGPALALGQVGRQMGRNCRAVDPFTKKSYSSLFHRIYFISCGDTWFDHCSSTFTLTLVETLTHLLEISPFLILSLGIGLPT